MTSDAQEIARLKVEVARLARLVEMLYARNGEPVPNVDLSLDDPPADVVEAVRSGNQIAAIKLWRDYTGIGLAEAKADMDVLAARFGA